MGEGPGEARSYAMAWVGSGEILAWGDPSTLQLFSSDGTFIASRPTREADQSLYPLGFGAGAWFVPAPQRSNWGSRITGVGAHD